MTKSDINDDEQTYQLRSIGLMTAIVAVVAIAAMSGATAAADQSTNTTEISQLTGSEIDNETIYVTYDISEIDNGSLSNPNDIDNQHGLYLQYDDEIVANYAVDWSEGSDNVTQKYIVNAPSRYNESGSVDRPLYSDDSVTRVTIDGEEVYDRSDGLLGGGGGSGSDSIIIVAIAAIAAALLLRNQ